MWYSTVVTAIQVPVVRIITLPTDFLRTTVPLWKKEEKNRKTKQKYHTHACVSDLHSKKEKRDFVLS